MENNDSDPLAHLEEEHTCGLCGGEGHDMRAEILRGSARAVQDLKDGFDAILEFMATEQPQDTLEAWLALKRQWATLVNAHTEVYETLDQMMSIQMAKIARKNNED